MPKFQIYRGSSFEEEYPFLDADLILIGRGQSSDIVLRDQHRRISRQHSAIVKLRRLNGRYFVRDLGSTYGTKVNGKSFDRKLLEEGDVVQIGEYRLVFSAMEGENCQHDLLRIVEKQEEEPFAEGTVAADRLSPQALRFTARQREYLEQLHLTARSAAGLSELAQIFMSPLLSLMKGDRGFVRLFSQLSTPETFEDFGVSGFRRGETIEISDPFFVERLRRGEPVREGRTALVPIIADGSMLGFLCMGRRPPGISFTDEETAFLGTFVRTAVSLSGAEDDAANSSMCEQVSLEWPPQLIGRSSKMRDLAIEIEGAAIGDMNVLLVGQTGTGKEVIAKAIHNKSPYCKGRFVAVHCGQVTESLAESEIFGYVAKSGIAGADPQGAPGWFEIANGGTILLDEIQSLSPTMQDKFLRVLQQREVLRYGAKTPVRVELNIVAASSTVDLLQAIEKGDFRSPLYYRFGTRLLVPPLRERKEDVPLLTHYFLDGQTPEAAATARSISRRALQQLMDYDWPGNIRELEYCIRKAVNKGKQIVFSWDIDLGERQLISEQGDQRSVSGQARKAKPRRMDEVEPEKIREALEATRGNITQASELLGYKSRMTMLNKMDKYGIPRNHGDVTKDSATK